MTRSATFGEKAAAVLLLLALAASWGCGKTGATSSPPPPPPPPAPPPPLAITTPGPLPVGVVGQTYSLKFQASGGTPPYTWTSPPTLGIPGLSLASDGTLSGTPQTPGSYFSSFRVTDSAGAVAALTYQLIIVTPLAFTTAASLPDGNIGVPYFLPLSVQGGMPPYTFALASGSNPLPAGITLSSFQQLLSGLPTVAGDFVFSLQVADSQSPPMLASQSFTLHLGNNLALPSTSFPLAVLNVPYSAPLKAYGGTPPYTFSVTGQFSVLPPGIQLDPSTGILQGTPIQTGSFRFFIQATDSASPPASVTNNQTINVNPPLAFITTSLPDFARGLFYSNFITTTGGSPPLTAKVVTGALPDGLSLGILNGNLLQMQGIPTKDGLFQFTLQVSDSYSPPNTATHDFQIRISEAVTLSAPPSNPLLEGQSVNWTFPASGGFPPYTWSINNLPSGWTFDPSTGNLSGTVPPPPGVGQSGPPNLGFGVSVHDSSSPPLAASTFFSVQIYGLLRIRTSMWPPVASGGNVWLLPWVSGGLAPYTWSIASGSLPPGLTLRATDGFISGTPTATGTFSFTLAVADGNQGSFAQNTSRQFTLTVKDRGQLTRNDTVAQATPLSNGHIVATISPFSDPSSAGPDMDVYQVSAPPGALVEVYVSANLDDVQPPNPNSLLPVLEVVDANAQRYQTCSAQGNLNFGPYTFPCVNGLNGHFSTQAYYIFQVPGSGTSPINFCIRVLDARGDARPDFLYTLGIFGVN